DLSEDPELDRRLDEGEEALDDPPVLLAEGAALELAEPGRADRIPMAPDPAQAAFVDVVRTAQGRRAAEGGGGVFVDRSIEERDGEAERRDAGPFLHAAAQHAPRVGADRIGVGEGPADVEVVDVRDVAAALDAAVEGELEQGLVEPLHHRAVRAGRARLAA